MKDKELIQELRKMIKVSQEDREYLESYYGGIYVYNGGNFDDVFEAGVEIGAIEAKVGMLDFLQQREAKHVYCPQDLISALWEEFDLTEDGELTEESDLTEEFDLTEDGELTEGAIYAGAGPCTCCVCTGGNFDDVFEAGVEIGAIEAKVGMLDFLQKWEAKHV